MTGQLQTITLKRVWKGREAANFGGGEDGEIKGPGPFGAMCLVVLRNFRDLLNKRGPGFPRSLRFFKPLSGTCQQDRRDV